MHKAGQPAVIGEMVAGILAKHIGGRIQENVAPDIQKKIDALMVDVKTVTLP